MADLIIKPNSATGDKLILQDRAGGAVITTADSGATIADGIALGTPASGVVTNLSGALQGHPSIVLGATQFVAATGPDSAAGTISGDYKYHIFTATKTGSAGFVVSARGNPAGSNTLEYYILAGGGGADADWGAGAGAGGCLTNTDMTCPAPGNYNVTVGGGGSNGSSGGVSGSPSSFNGVSAAGGAGGPDGSAAGVDGGCGSGKQSAAQHLGRDKGGQGKKRPHYQGGDGGMATKPVSNVSGSSGGGGIGGDGHAASMSGNSPLKAGDGGPGFADIGAGTVRGGGGGAGGYSPRSFSAGTGGPGGGNGNASPGGAGTSGAPNYGGGGGGGGGGSGASGSGGSGIVIIKYKFQ